MMVVPSSVLRSPFAAAETLGRLLLVFAIALVVAPGFAFAQPVVEETIDLESDRPESWAMRFFAGVTLPMGSATGS
ncbi:MAG TPA: hypothetical protein VGE86_03130, partial [Thermoanaerobaculia bacterium]